MILDICIFIMLVGAFYTLWWLGKDATLDRKECNNKTIQQLILDENNITSSINHNKDIVFEPNDIVVYEYLNPGPNISGQKYTCTVHKVDGEWVRDTNFGTCFSNSFRPAHVIIWEHKKFKKKKS